MSDPLQSGLAAGQAAYSGAAPKRMGISAADLSSVRGDVTSGLQSAAAQRQVLATNAAKQAAGQYPTSGTSAGMYNYMQGRGGYPVNAVPSGQPVNTGSGGYGGIGAGTGTLPGLVNTPIQRPYEKAVNTGTPTQTNIAKTAITNPTKMGKVTNPTVNMPKPSAMQQLIGVAGPAYLGYTMLDKFGGLKALGTGWDKLFGPEVLPTGYDASSTQALIDQYYTNPSVDLASAGSEDALQILADREAERAAAEVAAAAAADVGVYDAAGTQLATNVGDYFGAGAGAAGAGASTAVFDAAGAEIAPSVASYFGAAEAGAAGAGAGAGSGAGAAALTEAEAAAAAEAAGIDWALMAAEYGPYVAAAIIADQVLLDGQISEGIGDAVSGIGGALSDAVDDAGDFVSDTWEGITGGCFLTTAAAEHAGEQDDGPALTAMRDLRDDYMRKFPQGRKEIEWYYRKAPKIVAAIDKKKNARAIYMDMYKNYIKPTEKAVKAGNYEDAHQKYNRMIGFAKKASGLSTKELSMGKDNGIPKAIKKNFNTGGLTALANGGISVGSRYDPNIDGVAQANAGMSFQPTVGRFAAGGISHLGGYSDGGRLLRGPGDGVSDSIPATIGGKQPARLADGEFVIPARIVSEIGNGSTEAGARKLYAMMDRVQKARSKTVGKGKVAKNTRADKYLPK